MVVTDRWNRFTKAKLMGIYFGVSYKLTCRSLIMIIQLSKPHLLKTISKLSAKLVVVVR